MFAEKGLILFKIEATEGTDPVPTAAANAIMGYNLNIGIDPSVVARRPLRDSFDSLPHVMGGIMVPVSFEFELKGQGAVDVAPRWSPILQTCMMSETITALVSVAWDFVNAALKSGAGYFYMDGVLHKVTNIKGSGRITWRRDQTLRFAFSGLGMYIAPIDAAIAASAVFDTTLPPIAGSLALTLGAYSPIVKELDIDLGVTTGVRPDLNAADGIKGVAHVNREVTGLIVVEAVTEATHPFWANMKAGTAVALGGNLLGSAAGNKIAVTAPKAQYSRIEWGEDGGLRTYRVGLKFSPTTDTAADALQIKQT